MTINELIDLAWHRAGVLTPTTEQKNRGRDYLNLVKDDVQNRATWRFLYKTSTLTTTADTRTYSLASNVLYPIHFWDTTNDDTLEMRHPEEIIEMDPDEDEDGEQSLISIIGVNASTGLWEVDVYPTPSTSSETIKYRYYAAIADFTSSNDSSELLVLGFPQYVQPVLLWGTCAHIKEERENPTSANDWQKFVAALDAALKINDKFTNRRISLGPRNVGLRVVGEITPDA